MSDTLHSFEILRLRVPLGRTIGDNNCAYEAFNVCALKLTTRSGHVGWGFGEKAHGGRFTKPVSWKADLPVESALRAELQSAWSDLQGRSIEEHFERVPVPWRQWHLGASLHAALRMALWDLRGKLAGRPLYRLIGGTSARSDIFAYSSPCCFPQPQEWVSGYFRAKVASGFQAVKVKVGHPDIEWDVARLRAVREAVGPTVQIAVDGNTAWDAPTALHWIDRMNQEGVGVSYVEDPLPPTDLEGYRQLAARSPLRIVGHDYLVDPECLRPLLDTGALGALRMRDGIDHALATALVAAEYGLPLIQCNTFGEHSIHFSLTSPQVERMEFADLGWNNLFLEPVTAQRGRLVPPSGPGLGLEPDPEKLIAWRAQE